MNRDDASSPAPRRGAAVPYAAFISYRHRPRDRAWALRIMEALETYRTPKPFVAEAFPSRIGRLFRDEDEIPSSHDLSDEIRSALSRSDNLIVICSPDTPASRWVRREIQFFQEMGKGDRILPLLIAGEPDEFLPEELRRRRVVTLRPDGGEEVSFEEVEPVAADVRARKDEPKSTTERRALLRLAASLLGCRYDDLARRDEERRKQERRRYFAVASIASLVAAGAASWWWDANLRVHNQYCAAYGERWAVPFCIGEVSETQKKTRAATYRLHVQGGRVIEMTRVNGSDAPVDDPNSEYEDEAWTKEAAEWRYAYLNSALFAAPRLASVSLESRTGKPLRQISYEFSADRTQAVARFDLSFGVAERQSASGSALALEAHSSGNETRRSSIGQHRLSFDAQGLIVRRAFEPVGGGASVADATGAYGRIYECSASGQTRTIRNADALGDPLIEKSGVASLRRSYGERGELTALEWFDAAGEPRANAQWFAKVVFERGASGNVDKEIHLDEHGAITLRRDRQFAIFRENTTNAEIRWRAPIRRRRPADSQR